MSARRRKLPAVRRLRPFWLPLSLLAVAAACAGAFLVAWPGFAPQRVSVTGNRLVSSSEIARRAHVEANVNMWLQNTGAMAARVAAIPYVARVHVYRVPPATVLIAVRERAPFAVVRSGDDAAIVDRDLRVLVPATGTETLPAFVLQRYLALETGSFLNDGSLKTLRDDYEAMIAAHVVPLELTFDRFGGLVATMRGGVKILFGSEEDFDKKLALVNPVLSQLVRDRRRVEAVDLRAPSTPVLVFRKP